MSNLPFSEARLPNTTREEFFRGVDALSMWLIKLSVEGMSNNCLKVGGEAGRFFLGVLHPSLFKLACRGLLLPLGPNVGCVFFNSIDWVVFE